MSYASPSTGPLRVALVGLEFGAEFAPIYQAHPDVSSVVLCDLNGDRLAEVSEQFGIAETTTSLDDVCSDPTIDAVHLVTPVTVHAQQTLQVLSAGKHCACTIPAALSFEDLRAIVELQRTVGKVYMMMETAVRTREFFYVQDLIRDGAFGEIAFARGAHLQDMEGWPSYWQGFPPLMHITHALAPVLALLETRATEVRCFGSGHLKPEMAAVYGNTYPVETAIFGLESTDVRVEVTRSMFELARPYTESFAIYGNRLGFEWPQLEGEQPLLFELEPRSENRGRPVRATRFDAPDRPDLLPDELRRFTRQFVHEDGDHLSFVQGGGHGGSHPHLVHEFVRSVVTGQKPSIDAVTAANWTAAGLAAHQSAMTGGEKVIVPAFS